MTGPSGELRLRGRLVDASNATFLADDELGRAWLYKPVAGEAPLWDFPTGTLGRREVAAFALSEALDLGVVPLTVWVDGPLGEGSAQEWLEGGPTDLVDLLSPEELGDGWLPVLEARTGNDEPVFLAHRDDPRLRAIALFDALINNSDRKASHLIAVGEHVAGVDHGLTLHSDDKLRTVLWGWAGDAVTAEEQSLLRRVGDLAMPLSPGLGDGEWEALAARAGSILAEGRLPHPSGRWPGIPWPPM